MATTKTNEVKKEVKKRAVTAKITVERRSAGTYRVFVNGKTFGSVSATKMLGSCGVATINNMSCLDQITAPKGKNGAGIREEATRQLLNYIKTDMRVKFLVLSNNSKTVKINKTMCDIADKTSTTRVTATGSAVRVWIY